MNKIVIVAVGNAVVATVSLTISAITAIRNHSMLRKVNKSLGQVEYMTEDKIAEGMIETAVARSADKKVDRYMQKVEDDILQNANRKLEAQARNAVENAASGIREKAADEIARQVENIDIEKLKKRVCDKAEEHIIEKFDGCLDASVKKFQSNLDNTAKILNKISRATIEKEKDDDFHFVLL